MNWKNGKLMPNIDFDNAVGNLTHENYFHFIKICSHFIKIYSKKFFPIINVLPGTDKIFNITLSSNNKNTHHIDPLH